MERMAAALADVLPGSPRGGIAGTRFAAMIAATVRSPDTPGRRLVVVSSGREAAFLAPLPAALLTTDPDVRARLARFGLRDVAAIAGLPRTALVARFGMEGERLHARARGEETDPFRPRRTPERMALALPIDPPVDALEPLRFVLREHPKLMHEPDARIQLGVARQALLQSWHANQHHPQMPPIVEIAQLFEPSLFEPIGLIDDHQLCALRDAIGQ